MIGGVDLNTSTTFLVKENKVLLLRRIINLIKVKIITAAILVIIIVIAVYKATR